MNASHRYARLQSATRRGTIGVGVLIPVDDLERDNHYNHGRAQQRNAEPCPHHELQRKSREAEQAVKPDVEGTKIAIVVIPPGVPRFSLVFDVCLWKSNKRDEPTQEACDSLRPRNSSTTRRLMMRKSPVFGGIETSATSWIILYPIAETTLLIKVSPSRVRWRAVTTSNLSSAFFSIVAISSGGSCRSTSMTAHQSPLQLSIPAKVAAGWPKRWLKTKSPIHPFLAASSRMIISVRSGDGSREKMISYSPMRWRARGARGKDECSPPLYRPAPRPICAVYLVPSFVLDPSFGVTRGSIQPHVRHCATFWQSH